MAMVSEAAQGLPGVPERIGPYVPVFSHFLTRGQYRVVFRTDALPRTIVGEYMSIVADGEAKRIYVHKLSAIPLSGGEGYTVTMVFTVVDNPVWLPWIIRGGVFLAGTAATWLTLDKVEETAEGSGGILIIALAAAAALVTIVVALKK